MVGMSGRGGRTKGDISDPKEDEGEQGPTPAAPLAAQKTRATANVDIGVIFLVKKLGRGSWREGGGRGERKGRKGERGGRGGRLHWRRLQVDKLGRRLPRTLVQDIRH